MTSPTPFTEFHRFKGVQLELPIPQNRLRCGDRVRILGCSWLGEKHLNKTGRVINVCNDDSFTVRFRGNALGTFKRSHLELISRRKRW